MPVMVARDYQGDRFCAVGNLSEFLTIQGKGRYRLVQEVQGRTKFLSKGSVNEIVLRTRVYKSLRGKNSTTIQKLADTERRILSISGLRTSGSSIPPVLVTSPPFLAEQGSR